MVVLSGCADSKPEHISGKVIICGVGKDIQQAFPYTKANIEQLGSLFDDYEVFIYENNSTDDSPKLLQEWVGENSKVHVTSEVVDDTILSQTCYTRTLEGDYYRPERIARARNIVLDQVMQNKYDDYAYIVWIDLDFQESLPLKEIVKTFGRNEEWDAVFANGIDNRGIYYDGFSLRDQLLPGGAELIGDRWWKIRGNKGRLKLSKRRKWYPVHSAFGGLGLYKREAIKGCRYSALVTNDLVRFLKEQLLQKNTFQSKLYQEQLQRIKEILVVPELKQDLPRFNHMIDDFGFRFGDENEGLVLFMSSGIGQYPCVCEHVPFHASMALHGYNRLYINPKLILHYRDR